MTLLPEQYGTNDTEFSGERKRARCNEGCGRFQDTLEPEYSADPARQLLPLEELNLALVFYRCFARLECTEITALTGFRILLSRVEPIRARFQLANHERPPCEKKQQGLCLNGLRASRL
jgi:hypothetical protein